MILQMTICPPDGLPRYTVNVELARVTLGRDPRCDICLPFPTVSGHHLTLERRADGVFLTDMGSTNGTQVDGTMLPARQSRAIEHDSRATIVDLVLHFEFVDEYRREFTVTESATLMNEMFGDLLSLRETTPSHQGALFEILSGPGSGRRALIAPGWSGGTIGADRGAFLTIDDPRLPPEALTIRRQGSLFFGTPAPALSVTVNGEPWIGERRLRHEDQIGLGSAVVRFSDPLQAYFDDLALVDAPAEAPGPSGAATQQTLAATTDGSPPSPPTSQELPGDAESPREAAPASADADVPSAPPEPSRRRWGAVEFSLLLLSLVLIAGGVVAILFVFGLV